MRISKHKETAIVLGGFLVSGAAALIYEVIWTRALSLVLGSTVYALSTMLSTFMGGLAIGSYLGGKMSDRYDCHLLMFGLCEMGIGISGLASIPLIYYLPTVYPHIYKTLHFYPPLFFSVQILLCTAVMLLPTILMGATFPVVSRKITENLAEMGRKVGDAYSLNTVGAVLGSLLAGFFLIPAFGIKGATSFAAFLNLCIAALMILLSRRKRVISLGGGIVAFLAALLWLSQARTPTSLFTIYNLGTKMFKVDQAIAALQDVARHQVYYGEFPQGTVRAFRMPDNSFMLQTGGKLEGTGPSDVPNTKLLAYLPIASHPGPRDFLTIGLGAGVTLGAAKEHLKDVDLVEINPGVIEAVSRHGPQQVLQGVRVVRNDARNYLLTCEKRYDIISSEPSYPTESEVASLFTREFYELAARKLKREGIYCQWLPYYLLSDDDISMMIKTFGAVFPYTYVWSIRDSMDIILVGSKEPFLFGQDEIERRVRSLNRDVASWNFVVTRNPAQVSEIVRNPDVPVNTDDLPILEMHAANALLMGRNKGANTAK